MIAVLTPFWVSRFRSDRVVAMTSVVIVGSGFTGFECARRLARQMRRANASVDVTIISPADYMLYTPLLPDVAGGVIDGRFVTIPLAGTLKGVCAVRGRVDKVDFTGHTLTFTDPQQRAVRPGIGWCSRRVR